MRKLAFCICENKGADQLRGYYAKTKTQISFAVTEADQRLCFLYTASTIPLLAKSENSRL